MRILYFIGSLRSGGKERRLLELINYLKQNSEYEILLVLAYNKIDYTLFHKIDINHVILNKKTDSKNPRLFIDLYRICRDFEPDIIHTWGNMQTFFVIPVSLIKKIPIVNSQITSVRPNLKKQSFLNLTTKINFNFSNIVTSNSIAGLRAFNRPVNSKYKVVYNGINLQRFEKMPPKNELRKKYRLKTKYAVVMVASFNKNKDYTRYLRICKIIQSVGKDITFYAVGTGPDLEDMKKKADSWELTNIRFTGQVSDVEEIIAICDLGVLLTNAETHGEGISNSILEYMALGKPVIANDCGGTREIVRQGINGYLITNETDAEVAKKINSIILNNERKSRLGEGGKRIISEEFTIEKMGSSFKKIYHTIT